MSFTYKIDKNPKKRDESPYSKTHISDHSQFGDGHSPSYKSPEQSLDPNVRSSMESIFGFDFSKVRIHTDRKAADSADFMNANAYTIGENIYFGKEQYSPGTDKGRRLLIHELTHVVQSKLGALYPNKVSSPIDLLEEEAKRITSDFKVGSEIIEIRQLAQDTSLTLRAPKDDPVQGPSPKDPPVQGPSDLEAGRPTYGNLRPYSPFLNTGDKITEGVRRVDLFKHGDNWFEWEIEIRNNTTVYNGDPVIATGEYDFVIQDGKMIGVRNAPKVGHIEASQGGRVTWAGTIQFIKGKLKEWTNDSGHHQIPESMNKLHIEGQGKSPHPDLPVEQYHKVENLARNTQFPVIQEKPNPVPEGSPTEPVTTVPKGSLVSGAILPVVRVAGGILTVLGTPLMAIDVVRSEKMKQYVFDYYYFADEGGIFRLHGNEPWFSENEYFKIYLTGLAAQMGIHIPISESEFYDLWELGKKWYGYVNFWGDWVPGTVRTKLEVVDNTIA